MKKILLGIILFSIYTNVLAAYNAPSDFPDLQECTRTTIEKGKQDLANTTYNLAYDTQNVDKNGDHVDGYIRMSIANLPDGYWAEIKIDENSSYRFTSENKTYNVYGDVYNLTFYNSSCTTPIKTMNIRIPFYKIYCGVNADCEKDPWFDGTFENTASNLEKKNKVKVNIVLVIILVILLLIIAIFAATIIKRRRDRAKNM